MILSGQPKSAQIQAICALPGMQAAQDALPSHGRKSREAIGGRASAIALPAPSRPRTAIRALPDRQGLHQFSLARTPGGVWLGGRLSRAVDFRARFGHLGLEFG